MQDLALSFAEDQRVLAVLASKDERFDLDPAALATPENLGDERAVLDAHAPLVDFDIGVVTSSRERFEFRLPEQRARGGGSSSLE